MKGLFRYDLEMLFCQKQALLILVFLFLIYLISGQGEVFGIGFLPLFLTGMCIRIELYVMEAGQVRYYFTLPFSRWQFVIEKYLFPMICMSLTLAFCVLCLGMNMKMDELLLICGSVFSGGFLLVCLSVPFQISFGRLGSWMMAVFIALLCLSFAYFGTAEVITSTSFISFITGIRWYWYVLILLAMLSVSVFISYRIISRKRF